MIDSYILKSKENWKPIMKKLLSIFTTFTAVSVVEPTVVACKSDADGVTVDSILKAIAAHYDVTTEAKRA